MSVLAQASRYSTRIIRTGYFGATAIVRPSSWAKPVISKWSDQHVLARTRLLLCASSAITAAFLTSHGLRNSSVAMAEYSTVTSASSSASTVGSHSTPDIVLYQFEVCPFCNKVRAYLDYYKIPYRVVEVDPLRKTELKELDGTYKKVPVAVINGKQVNGSSAVIDAVNVFLPEGENSGQPGTEINSKTKSEEHWLDWLENHLIHLIAPNIYRTPSESLQTFNYIADKSKFSAWERATIRYTGAAAMFMIGKRLKKKYDIKDEREAISQAVNDWMDAIRNGGGMYLDGRRDPGVADLSIYGVFKSIETFDTFTEVRQRNQEFAQWFDRTKQIVGESSRTQEV